MLTIKVPASEYFNDTTEEFVTIPETTLKLIHSLVSLSKWESKYEKPFLDTRDKTTEETLYYIECMAEEEIPRVVMNNLTMENYSRIQEYIQSNQTATWFTDDGAKSSSGQKITSELIYFWMVSHNIPFECQNWHLNRLLTLIRVCGEQNKPKKKMSKSEIMKRNRELNAQRKAEMGTSG